MHLATRQEVLYIMVPSTSWLPIEWIVCNAADVDDAHARAAGELHQAGSVASMTVDGRPLLCILRWRDDERDALCHSLDNLWRSFQQEVNTSTWDLVGVVPEPNHGDWVVVRPVVEDGVAQWIWIDSQGLY
jgi:hypothetical protein